MLTERLSDVRPAPHPDLLESFARSVALRGDHPAVVGPEGTLGYAALDQQTNQLANRLRALGVGPESLVGISIERGAFELVAMLATLKAGGAYLPLDPTLPVDRLRAIVEDAGPDLVVAHPISPLATGLVPGLRLLRADDVASATAGHSDADPDVATDPEQLAYVLFTSGSTGRPKGVEITRGAFSTFLGSMAHTPGMTKDDRLLAITTTSFDIAGLELFLPLCVGATVVIADRATARDPRLLRARLEREAISVLQATPATWRMLLESGWRGDGRLRMFCGGEALSPALADRLLATGGELWNLYGPTETTVWSSLERIRVGYDRITVGRPIDGTTVQVLDEALGPLPPGQEGELWIGGRGVARGYRGRPDLTAERFKADPRNPGGVIYRTGDLGRQLADGRFECLGRIDHQVKVRGLRVELGEIEAILRGVAGVSDVLVVAEQRDGDPRVIAYWLGTARRQALIEEARRSLPAYMVPAAFVPLDAFPLNANGKVDRKRLPAPGSIAEEIESRARPRTDVETRIAAVWSEMLGIPQVPIDESFFTLGGTSLVAVEVAARLEAELKVPVPLQTFFESPTIESLASSLGKSISPDDPIVVRLAGSEPDQPPLFCLFGIQLYQELAIAIGRHSRRPVFGVHVPFRYRPGLEPPPAMGQIARAYLDLIRRHQPRGPYHLLGLCFGGVVAFEVARQLEAQGERCSGVTIIDAILPSAVRVDRWKQVRAQAGLARREPRAFARRLLDWTRAHGRVLPVVGAALRPAVPGNPVARVDLSVDGPEVDEEVRRFSAGDGRVAAPILVVRATDPPPLAWMTVDAHQGWRERGSEVVVLDIPASHLEVLRLPHARALAAAIAQVAG